jgi:hypothetical protein
MRRLIMTVAVAAAALLAPSAALATVAPVLTGLSPANSPTLTWTSGSTMPGITSVTYQVMRAPLVCASATPGDFAQVGGDIVDGPLSFTDSSALTDGAYCYYIHAVELMLPADSNQLDMTVDKTPPVVTAVTRTGGDGCTTAFTLTSATVTDASVVALTANGTPFSPGLPYVVPGNPYDVVPVSVVATDAAGNVSTPPFVVADQRVLDVSGPGATALEVTTDPSGQKATLNWTPSVNDGAPVTYKLRTKGPQGVTNATFASGPVVVPALQVDATYEFTLEPVDACSRSGGTSVRLVRLNDTSPPTMPVVAAPIFNTVSHIVALTWTAATDNIQVDHYEILRNGVPIGATDSTAFVDIAPIEHAQLSYVVRAVDTNGNSADSQPAMKFVPDWEAPTAPVLSVSMSGATATLRWSAASDNIGVVAYDVIRDGKQIASVASTVRTYKDVNVPAGTRVWQVRSRDDAGLIATSAEQRQRVVKSRSRVSVVGAHLVGTTKSAARYSLKARARLLVDLRVTGTVSKAKLRIYVRSGRTRITVWRGTPGTSAPRVRLGSALARRGFVSIKLSRALHTGRIRLVLISSGKIVIVGKGAHEPAMKAG